MARYPTKLNAKRHPRRSLAPLWLALAGLGLVLAAAWAVLGGAQTKVSVEVKGQPRLKLETTRIDHGDVRLGTPIRDEVRVTNVGDQPLRFTRAPYVEVKEGC